MSEPVKSHDVTLAAKELSVYWAITDDPIVEWGLGILQKEDDTYINGPLFEALAHSVEFSEEPIVGTAWQNHILNLILETENVFSRKAELGPLSEMGPTLIETARKDLRALQILYNADKDMPFITYGFNPMVPLLDGLTSIRLELKELLSKSEDWGLCLDKIANYYRKVGSGIFGKYLAFRWSHTDKGGYLEGIKRPDPIRLEELIGYEMEKKEVIQNTHQFVKGYPANNMLLYGDRGTGKSSTIKALIHKFGEEGLRLVEVSQEDLQDFPQILHSLRDRSRKFILFIDDLSFDEGERGYKSLKAILEGGIEVQPQNVLIYATSNRRHLVKEKISDSKDSFFSSKRMDDEIRREDTVQEKLSLSDRFGITITFVSPDQEEYLKIVEGLAKERELRISREDLRRRAIQWELWRNGRSGRTARQFIDQLQGELFLMEELSKR